jgi:hypothetical protein
MRGTSEVGWFGLASLPGLLSSNLVIHVGWNERHRLSGPARREHLISREVASIAGKARMPQKRGFDTV